MCFDDLLVIGDLETDHLIPSNHAVNPLTFRIHLLLYAQALLGDGFWARSCYASGYRMNHSTRYLGLMRLLQLRLVRIRAGLCDWNNPVETTVRTP
jgi:hypothetical protein